MSDSSDLIKINFGEHSYVPLTSIVWLVVAEPSWALDFVMMVAAVTASAVAATAAVRFRLW